MNTAAATASPEPTASRGWARRGAQSSFQRSRAGRRGEPGSREGTGALAGGASTGAWRPPQRRTGVDAELVGQQVADMTVGGERLRLPAAAVERQHELAVQPFPQRVLGGQLVEFGGQRVVPAERQVGVDPGFHRGQPQFLQAHGLRLDERVVGQVG
jgi:hypothetical protein